MPPRAILCTTRPCKNSGSGDVGWLAEKSKKVDVHSLRKPRSGPAIPNRYDGLAVGRVVDPGEQPQPEAPAGSNPATWSVASAPLAAAVRHGLDRWRYPQGAPRAAPPVLEAPPLRQSMTFSIRSYL